MFEKRWLVEAAGVEPASEIVVSRETPCVVYSVNSLPALRIDKKREELVRWSRRHHTDRAV